MRSHNVVHCAGRREDGAHREREGREYPEECKWMETGERKGEESETEVDSGCG